MPNREIKELFKDEFIDISFGESQFIKTMESLKRNKLEDFEKNLQKILLNSTSYQDTKNEEDLEKEVKQTIEQIISKKYDFSLKERGIKDIIILGVAFCGKLVKASYK